MKVSIGIIAGVLVLAAVTTASTVFAPLALAFFIMALVLPVQSRLRYEAPRVGKGEMAFGIGIENCDPKTIRL